MIMSVDARSAELAVIRAGAAIADRVARVGMPDELRPEIYGLVTVVAPGPIVLHRSSVCRSAMIILFPAPPLPRRGGG